MKILVRLFSSYSIIGLILAISLIIISTDHLNKKTKFNEIKFQASLYVPPQKIEKFTFGFQELIADVLWIQFIQKLSICSNNIKICTLSDKLGEMLLRITELSPRFRMPYALGPLMLTFLLDEKKYSQMILTKAELYFPNDWTIFYRGATILLYDIGDKKKAALYFDKAARLGAPQWVFALAAKLYSEEGMVVEQQNLIQTLDEIKLPEEIKHRILLRLKSSKLKDSN